MAEVMETVTAITKMVRGGIEAVPIYSIVGQPTLNYIQHPVKQNAAFASHFATTKCVGNHGFLPLVITETKMCIAYQNQKLDCERIKNTELLNPKIEEDTKGSELLRFQEEHRVN